MMQHLVTETNRYYKEKIPTVERLENLPLRSRFRDWVDVTLPEMKAYFAVLILIAFAPT